MLSTSNGGEGSASAVAAARPRDSVPTTLRAAPARASAAARDGVVAAASIHVSATDARPVRVASSTGSPASASRSATYRRLHRHAAQRARATDTGSHPSTRGLLSGA